MAITTSTARADIFKEIYALVKSKAPSGTIVANSYPDKLTTDKMIVVNPPEMPRTINGFGGGTYDRSGSLDIEVYAKNTKDAVELLDSVEHIIFNNLASISVQNVQAGESTMAYVDFGTKTLKGFVLPLSFKFVR